MPPDWTPSKRPRSETTGCMEGLCVSESGLNLSKKNSQQTIQSIAQFTIFNWSSGDYGRLVMEGHPTGELKKGLTKSINMDLARRYKFISIGKGTHLKGV